MSKLTEIKERVKSFNADPNLYGVIMTVDEMNHLLSLLEEKDKALQDIAANYNHSYKYEFVHLGDAGIALTDCVEIARKALNTSSNNEGEI
ncbi:hypothetical protein R50345_05945 [Paenibacillus sp. FSL R5-0345]|uniref:hypothetical protein n=1 Tax=Paenibacillus sp. FSL R5-0345 TaxID=1536770 RepID=UPI0004F655E5|nr:hypothetical protein [Paenibacillus sp. FSL R5-0345]AIQ34207.1 hypothetical protein R50345_05945 [Paenibacillus sp. FSL R5-0345]